MNVLERVLFLRGVPIFSGLTGEELAEVAQLADEVERPSGEEILEAGQPDTALHVIVEGRAAIVVDGATRLTLEPRQVVGELSLVEAGPRPGSVVAVTDVTLLRIEAEAFRALAREKPDVALGVASTLARRLRAAGVS